MQKSDNIGAALYIRLSKEDEGERESESVTNQRSILKTFAEERNIGIFDTYIDDGWSGTGFDRPSFNRMIRDIERGKVNTVIVKDMSRLGRDYIMTGYYMERYFPEKQVRFISVLDGIDTKYDSTANDITPFRAIMNDMYSKDISKKIRSVKRDKQRKGLFIGGKAPYGYHIDSKNKNKLAVDATAAETVRRIFSHANEGATPSETAEMLNREHIPAPSVYAGLRADCKWSGASVSAILRNEMYIGNMVQGKRKRAGYKSKKCISLPREQWSIVQGTHEPIIDSGLFYAVNEKRTVRKRRGKNDFPLKGVIFCDTCGKPMTVTKRINTAGENILYIICRTKTCNGHCLRYDIMEAETEKLLQNALNSITQADIDKALKRVYESATENNDKKKKELDNAIDRLYSDRIEGKIEEGDYFRLYRSLKERRERLLDKKTLYYDAETIENDFKREMSSSRELIKSLINRIEVGQNKEIRIRLNYTSISEE